MVVGVLQLDISIPDARSLKDKRSVIKSIKDRLGGRHNVSVAEVDYLDEHQRSTVAVAMVSNNRRFVDECLSKIVDEVRMARSAVLLNYELEMF
jgi:uncharacterized protein YlxP (DUF503 family)